MKYRKLMNVKEENIIGDHERGELDDSGFSEIERIFSIKISQKRKKD